MTIFLWVKLKNEIMGKIKKDDDDWLKYTKGYTKIIFNSDLF